MNQSRGKSNKNSGGNATSKTDDKKYEYDGHPLGYATFKDKVKAKLRDTDSLNLLKQDLELRRGLTHQDH